MKKIKMTLEEELKHKDLQIGYLEESKKNLESEVSRLNKIITEQKIKIEELESIKINDTYKGGRKRKISDSKVAELRKEGFKLTEVAELLNVGIATVKRSVARNKKLGK